MSHQAAVAYAFNPGRVRARWIPEFFCALLVVYDEVYRL